MVRIKPVPNKVKNFSVFDKSKYCVIEKRLGFPKGDNHINDPLGVEELSKRMLRHYHRRFRKRKFNRCH